MVSSQLPNGVTYHPNTHQDRLGKLQEHLRMLSVLFRKLRLVYDKCNENCAGMDPIPPEVRRGDTERNVCTLCNVSLTAESQRTVLSLTCTDSNNVLILKSNIHRPGL